MDLQSSNLDSCERAVYMSAASRCGLFDRGLYLLVNFIRENVSFYVIKWPDLFSWEMLLGRGNVRDWPVENFAM